ncbi:hypothetical protein, partial [Salmonella enterica]|uniref:hypothetical protein n=1 Tax=Salmonella enterica TaxID=28901 RepID=UPI00398C39B2
VYFRPRFSRHALSFVGLLPKVGGNPALRSGDAQLRLAEEQTKLGHLNNTAVTIPAATLSDLVAQQAQKTPEASAFADAPYHFPYREIPEQVVALADAPAERGFQPVDTVAGAFPGPGFPSLPLTRLVMVR